MTRDESKAALDRAHELLDKIDIQTRAVGRPVGGIPELRAMFTQLLADRPLPQNDICGVNEAISEMQAMAIDAKRRVVAAACRAADGTIFIGIRHFSPDMLKMFILAGYVGQMADCDQGFVDQWGNYLTRQEAFEIALRQGQYRPYPPYNFGTLYSEDLY